MALAVASDWRQHGGGSLATSEAAWRLQWRRQRQWQGQGQRQRQRQRQRQLQRQLGGSGSLVAAAAVVALPPLLPKLPQLQ